MNNAVAVRRWAHGLISAFVGDMDDRLKAVCCKPGSAKRVHQARRSMARLEAALADFAAITAGRQKLQTRVHALRRRAGKVRDADVLCKRLKDYGAGAEVLRKSLRQRRKRGIRKFIEAARKSPSRFKTGNPIAGARRVPLADSMSVSDANRNVVRVRFAELLEASSALRSEDGDALHALRLAAKRLRYALQRLGSERLQLFEADDALDDFAKALGAAHDSGVLARRAIECGAADVAERSRRERLQQIESARRLWRDLTRDSGPIAALGAYARFHSV